MPDHTNIWSPQAAIFEQKIIWKKTLKQKRKSLKILPLFAVTCSAGNQSHRAVSWYSTCCPGRAKWLCSSSYICFQPSGEVTGKFHISHSPLLQLCFFCPSDSCTSRSSHPGLGFPVCRCLYFLFCPFSFLGLALLFQHISSSGSCTSCSVLPVLALPVQHIQFLHFLFSTSGSCTSCLSIRFSTSCMKLPHEFSIVSLQPEEQTYESGRTNWVSSTNECFLGVIWCRQ